MTTSDQTAAQLAQIGKSEYDLFKTLSSPSVDQQTRERCEKMLAEFEIRRYTLALDSLTKDAPKGKRHFLEEELREAQEHLETLNAH